MRFIANYWKHVLKDVYDRCTELIDLDVKQECINAADKKEVTQYIDSAAFKALDMRETTKVLREARQRVAKKIGSLQRLARSARLSQSSPIMIGRINTYTKYLPSRGRLAKDVCNGWWRESYGARGNHRQTQNASAYC